MKEQDACEENDLQASVRRAIIGSDLNIEDLYLQISSIGRTEESDGEKET